MRVFCIEMLLRNYFYTHKLPKYHYKGEEVPNSYEFRLKHKNGNIIYLILSVGLLNYHGEKAILGTLKDITKLKVYQDEIIKEKEKAEQATLSKSMFLAGMSHEIRNHMSSIIGISEMLSETKLSKEQKEYVDVINVSGSNLLNIINEILDFSKIEAKYDFRNKDQQLQLITKDNEVKSLKIKTQKYIIYFIASLSLLILVLVFVFYSRSITNKRARILMEEKNSRITEQKILLEKTISELKESEEKQKSLVENILDGIFIIQNNRLIYINEAVVNITGYSIKELHSLTFRDIIADEDLEMILLNHKARLKGEEVPNSYEFRLKHKNGNIIYLILSVGLLNYHGEKAILGTLKDITKLKVYQDEIIKEKEKAEQATLSKSMFLAGMSHEIRNHMSSIIGISEMLSETKLSKEQKEYVDVINVSGSNLLNIINEIFEIISEGHHLIFSEYLHLYRILYTIRFSWL